ncbi:pentapeptide repeat-containing protein (plasmid) [Acaryochloris sp. 'Moss Beach']|uniref:pentapeptide repeat-containing protein n=1 Tax=Acaryochloris sp. 'Moss Beach' TaxID=2740837 RepID=UPI001F252C73|nr:pentapeptide repeat-containing protein [Acaryochloris sp. 'Moss Beach']UJB72987.1 pentapeptide repeat-containing protein [Acaryochloris sp. 'Moss Beach']
MTSNTIDNNHGLSIGWWSAAIGGTTISAVISSIGIASAITLAGVIADIYIRYLVIISAFFGGFLGSFIRILSRNGARILLGNPAWNWAWIDLFWSWIWSWSIAILGTLIALSALKGEKRFALIQKLAIAFSAYIGTSFKGSDLSNANYSKANLRNTDFREAILYQTYWYKCKNLDIILAGNSYLRYQSIRELIVNLQGKGHIYDNLPLSGINLNNAKLSDASFISTDLNGASLQCTDLSRTLLKQTQLDGADLSKSQLTGAYIEDWGITANTILNEIDCKYIYMHLPTKNNPDPLRKPDNHHEFFRAGDFDDFIKPIVDTLDLYHNQGIDPRAIAIAFKTLAEHNPNDELEIVAMERRGKDKFLLKAKTSESANHSELSKEYFEIYSQVKTFAYQDIKLIISEKEDRIKSLENFVEIALKRPSFYAENYKQTGDFMPEDKKY